MLIDSSPDVTTIKIDLKLSTLKLLQLNTLIQISNYFKTSDGESIIKLGSNCNTREYTFTRSIHILRIYCN